MVNRKRDSSFTELSLQCENLIAKGETRPWPIDSTWHWPETDAARPIQYLAWKEALAGRGLRSASGTSAKKNVKGKDRNRCHDSPWKPWTLIARRRSRCKSAFPATVMIAGVVSASTSASQTVLRRTPQPREKQSITSRLRDYVHRDSSLFFFLSASQIRRRGQERRNYCRWYKCDKRACLSAKHDSYCLRERTEKCGFTRSHYLYSRELNRRIFLGREYYWLLIDLSK